ncbi:HEAT repeat domain-containing protein [Nonomuraea sp. NPDC049028]|uniref:HEAT repeat domain-containing protein n=1 Tax=Nonomuraea sp. NPDC049028 TaxID=3364348 RepID=UPI00371815FA
MSRSTGDPRAVFADRMRRLIEADGRPQDAIANQANAILKRHQDPRTGMDPRTGRPPRTVNRKRISEWIAGREFPEETVFEAVLETVLERIEGRKGVGRDLRDAQASRSCWRAARDVPQDPSWLEAYLEAARQAAEAHPYPGVLPDARLPPLSQVYVRRRSQLRAAPDESRAEADKDSSREEHTHVGSPADRLIAEEILSAGHDVLLLGGPGAGKSSLLRHTLIAVVTSERASPNATVADIPLYVPASCLTVQGLSFAGQLAAAVHDELSGRRVPELPADVFNHPPRRGARWLVLLDGLDEINDVRQRLQLTQRLREHRAGPYRFVLTSRLLPDDELRPLEQDRQLRIYELLPFDLRQLHDFADGWMRAAHEADPERLPDPERAVRAFLSQVADPPLSELAQIPLLATILCQLHAAGPDRVLPRDRYGIYQSFLELLRQRLHDPQVPGLPDATLAALRKVATRQHQDHDGDGDGKDLLGEVLRATDGLRPPGMPVRDWTARRSHLVRRTGLVTARDNSYTFIHQTISEFLAAQHVASDAQLSRQAFHDLFGWHNPRRPAALSSYRRFLIAAWHANPPPPGTPPQLTTAVHRWAIERDGAEIVIELVTEGIALPPQIVNVATNTLTTLTADPTVNGTSRVVVARKLTELGGPRAIEVWAALATDPTLNDHRRGDAARALARLDDARATEVWAAQAADPTLSGAYRVEAARALSRLDDARAVEVWAALATDPTFDADFRVDPARALAERGDPRGIDVLDALAANPHFDYCVLAARTLAELGDPRGNDLLAALATDPTLTDRRRANAARTLAELGDPRGNDLLTALATDPTVSDVFRGTATEALAELGDPRANDLLATLATDPTTYESVRMGAVRTLTDLNDLRAAEVWVALATDVTLGEENRVWAARALVELGDPRAVQVCAKLATDPTMIAYGRVWAARAVSELGDPHGNDLLAALATDPTLSGNWHNDAARALAELGDPRANDLLAALATDPSRQDCYRVGAARHLAELGGPRGNDLLAALAIDPSFTERVWAASELAKSGDPRAVQVCAKLATDSTVSYVSRGTVVRELAKLGGPNAAEAWISMAADAMVVQDRTAASRALAEVDSPQALKLLTALATDSTQADLRRLGAARALTLLSDQRGSDLLAVLATDPTLHRLVRWIAAREVLEVDVPQIVEMWAALATDSTLDSYHRAKAVQRLGHVNQWSWWRRRTAVWIVMLTGRVPKALLFRK